MIESITLLAIVVGLVMVLLRMNPQHLKVGAAVRNATFTLEADSRDALKASPPFEMTESWASVVEARNGGVDRLLHADALELRPTVGTPWSGNPDVDS
jgi:hypothetical protein